MKKILAVDIDAITINIISSLMTEHTTDFEILTTDKMEEMHDIFKSLSVDVAIIDIKKPSTNDIEILKFIAKTYTKTPLIAMTAFETIEIESAIKSIGSLQYFEKPVDFKELADKIAEVLESSVRGEIHGISLASFLQMSEMEKTSCSLKVKTSEKEGRLFMIKGALIAAEAGELTGKDAVYEILGWDSPVIEIEDAEPNRRKEISTPLMSLLMEGLRRKDEESGKVDKSKISAQKAKNISIVSSADRIKGIVKPQKEKDTPETGPKPETGDIPQDFGEYMDAQGKITDAGKLLKRKRIIANTLKIAAGMIILIAIALTWQFMVKPWLVQRNYEKTIAQVRNAGGLQSKLGILNDYLTAHPDSQYASKLQQIKKETLEAIKTRDFEQTLEKVDKLAINEDYKAKAEAIYNNFLKQYPDSNFAREIQERIAEIPAIIDDAEFRALMDIPANQYSKRLTAYRQYLKNHPDGKNTPKVQKMITRLGENLFQHIKIKKSQCDEKNKWQPCILLCQYFTKNFQSHKRLDEVKQLRKTMEDQRDLIRLTAEAAENEEYSQKTKQLYQQYLKKNPDTTIRSTLEARIARIEKKQNQEKTWNDLLAYVQNNENSVFKRTGKMEQYIKSNPPSVYAEEAASILSWLKKEKQEELDRIARQKALAEKKRQKKADLDRKKDKIRERIKKAGNRYVEKVTNTITDTQTGLTWCMLDSFSATGECMDHKSATKYVDNLNTGGFDDWRLPDPSELMVIYNDTPRFPAEGANWYWTNEVFSAAWQKKAHIVKLNPNGHWIKSEVLLLDRCGGVRAVRP